MGSGIGEAFILSQSFAVGRKEEILQNPLSPELPGVSVLPGDDAMSHWWREGTRRAALNWPSQQDLTIEQAP